MLKCKTKKYASVGLSCMLLAFLLLTLAGCDATSDPKVSYQATGSWSGTLGADRVRGIIAPDGSYQLAVVDVNGDFIPGAGEYVGAVTIVDGENNIGRMTVAYLRPPASGEPPVSAVILPTVTFKLSGTTLYSEDAPYNLSRTSDANGPAAQVDVAGRWSLSVNETTPDITNLIVDVAGNLSGNDGDACLYSGTLKLIDPAWNIFQLNLKFSDYPLKDCKEDTLLPYEGLAMALPIENNRQHLWLASTVWTSSGTRTGTFIENLAATINVAPVARMTANAIELQESDDPTTIEVKKFSVPVVLSAELSSDDNKDPLTYQWSGTAPDGVVLNFTGTSVNTFTPGIEGVYTFSLIVNDGLLSSELIERRIKVVRVTDRFVDCYNGTVLDTKNNSNLFWLKDAGCSNLHGPVEDFWWVNLFTANANVVSLASPLQECLLEDGSVATNWRLPSRAEFTSIREPFGTPPALANGAGTNQWQEGDVFVNVGINPFSPGPDNKFWRYWTSDVDGAGNVVNFGYEVESPPNWSEVADPENDVRAVWAVRDAIATDEVEECKEALPPTN
jgi:hypothetical protein